MRTSAPLLSLRHAIGTLRNLPVAYPRFFARRVLVAALVSLVLLVTIIIVLTHGDSESENAYAWSRICVRKVIANPKAAEFPPYPSDVVEVSRDERTGVFTVRAEVITESMAGLQVRHAYVAELKHRRWQNEWELVHLDID
jgi:hypothetical protein